MTLIFAIITVLDASAQGIRTITAGNTNLNSPVITLASNSFAVFRGGWGVQSASANYNGPSLVASIQGIPFSWSLGLTPGTATPAPMGLTISGPATLQVQSPAIGAVGFATFDIEPGPFPPGKAVTIGAYSGNVKVTMEPSTDLVNWTAAVNGQVYTNSPIAQFFRITLVTNASP